MLLLVSVRVGRGGVTACCIISGTVAKAIPDKFYSGIETRYNVKPKNFTR